MSSHSGSGRTLAVVSHKRHVINADGTVSVPGGFRSITNEIARHWERVYLCVPCEYAADVGGREYRSNITLVPLPPYRSRMQMLLRLPVIVTRIHRALRRSDIGYAMGPNDMGVVGMVLARVTRRPFFASLDTDRAGQVLTRGYGSLVAGAKYYLNIGVMYPLIRGLCRNRPVFVTGNMFMGSGSWWRQWIKSTYGSDEMPSFREPGEPERPRIVFAGRLSAEKNLPVLLQAVADLQQRERPVELYVIGDGPMAAQWQQRAEDLGVDGQFVGNLPNDELMKGRFFDADALVLPSREERQGKVLLEAMACSVPVVAANVGGIPSVIVDQENGLLFDPDDPQQLATQLERLLFVDQALRRQLVSNGYRYARDHALDTEVSRLVETVDQWSRTAGVPGT